MAGERILVIEDDTDIMELLKYNLVNEGYAVIGVASGEEGLISVQENPPDLLLLDLMLPGIDGLDVCRRLKADPGTQPIPIVMISAKGEESDIVAGLELGADDYITKPFSPRVVIARVRAVLRRKQEESVNDTATLSRQEIVINPGKYEVLVAGERVELTPTEFGILYYLARRPGWVFTRYQIVDGIRSDGAVVTDRSVDVQIVGLRRKLGPAGKYIETVRGVGYRFKE